MDQGSGCEIEELTGAGLRNNLRGGYYCFVRITDMCTIIEAIFQRIWPH